MAKKEPKTVSELMAIMSPEDAKTLRHLTNQARAGVVEEVSNGLAILAASYPKIKFELFARGGGLSVSIREKT